jgi:hypothetical protein
MLANDLLTRRLSCQAVSPSHAQTRRFFDLFHANKPTSHSNAATILDVDMGYLQFSSSRTLHA